VARQKSLRTYAIKQDGNLLIYHLPEKPKVVVTGYEVHCGQHGEVEPDETLCSQAFDVPGLKDLKEGELVEVTGLQLRSE
jgi:hypothetical protein